VRPADTTPSKIVRLLRSAGTREVHMRIASPPVVGSCLYIIDNSSDGELILNQMGLEGARQLIGSDSLLSSRSTCCIVYTARRRGTTASPRRLLLSQAPSAANTDQAVYRIR
jgi:hypothetical protein